MKLRIVSLGLVAILLGIGLYLALQGFSTETSSIEIGKFDGERALADVETQVNFGPRLPESPAQTAFIEWLTSELRAINWEVEIQQTSYQGKPIKNVIAARGKGDSWLILGAHYDSRLLADRDPDPAKRSTPVPGANDGASGVAVLLELARVLPVDEDREIWLAFFDAEDNGHIGDWDWIMGSRAFAESLQVKPDTVVIVDMVGDADLSIFWEQNSDPTLLKEIWQVAADLGYNQFIPDYKYRILDDHIPFIEIGIPAVDIIDIDYPYYHTTQDTADKVSAQSLQAVGDTLLTWLLQP